MKTSDKTSDKLLYCPFCGGEIKLMFLNYETFEDCVWDESVGNVSTWFRCYSCDSEFFHNEPIDIPEKQIEWWNTRKPMERILERLEEMLKVHETQAVFSSDSERAYMKAIKILNEEGGIE